MEKKKETNAQLKKRIEKALVHVEKTKDTKSVYFSDRGLRLTINEDCAIISTGFHKHIFNKITSSGISKPYMYTDMVIDLALENSCLVEDENVIGEKYYSYQRLLDVLKNNEEKNYDYLIVYYYSMWLYNIYNPLYSISESESSSFVVFLTYVVNVATNSIILEEKKDDVTNRQIVNELCARIKKFTSDIDERVIFAKMTDEDFAKKEMEAMNEQENENIIEMNVKSEANGK